MMMMMMMGKAVLQRQVVLGFGGKVVLLRMVVFVFALGIYG